MNYVNEVNEVKIKYKNITLVNDRFDDYIERSCYTIIDEERFGASIAIDLMHKENDKITIDEILEAVEDSLGDLKKDLIFHVKEYLNNNYDGKIID